MDYISVYTSTGSGPWVLDYSFGWFSTPPVIVFLCIPHFRSIEEGSVAIVGVVVIGIGYWECNFRN